MEPYRPVIPGLETDLDAFLLEHFSTRYSRVLTASEDTNRNPFLQIVVPMAIDHKGLMHSLLALSGAHLVRFQPKEEYIRRRDKHYGAAISALHEEVMEASKHNADVPDPMIASMILQCLIPVSEGTTEGKHRSHLIAAKEYIKFRPNEKFGKFAYEFYMYQEMSNQITSINRSHSQIEELPDDDSLPRFPAPGIIQRSEGNMIGVFDGLSRFISSISIIRHSIRTRKNNDIEPTIEYQTIMHTQTIDKELHEWVNSAQESTPRYIAGELYRSSIVVYLHRTIRASRAAEDLTARVNRGIQLLQLLPPSDSTQCILLLPIFILGVAAFEEHQRIQIEVAFAKLEQYSRLGNIAPTREVVRKVWEMMDKGDERSWDWEKIMEDMDYDLLVT